MSLTVVITRDVEDRYRGLLSSALLEAAPGVYVSRDLNARARETIWEVVRDWHATLRRGSVTMLFQDHKEDGGIAVRSVGVPARRPVKIDGALLMHRVSE